MNVCNFSVHSLMLYSTAERIHLPSLHMPSLWEPEKKERKEKNKKEKKKPGKKNTKRCYLGAVYSVFRLHAVFEQV